MSVPATDPRWPKVLSLSVHEFRTPMTVVAGYIRMLLKERAGPLSDQQRKLLEEAEKSCARLSALLAEVSELSNLEAGTAPLNKGPVEINALLADAVKSLPPLPDRDVPVTLDLPGEPFQFEGDAVRLTQAFTSIVAALRRELIGEDPLVVRGRRSGGAYELLVGDPATIDALGAEAPDARGVFDEWRGGVGLTLAVARRVLNAHGATIAAAPDGRKSGARILLSHA
ncbi:MAG TPA: HAMP domain-containing sensor histidine kinase [Vicinamibacterales bacterium]|nr:HAMP domain-containing sensor histidine kinase [Vicinamibacterales bacterium]